MSGWGSYKHGSRRGSAARFPPWVILLPAAAPTVPGPAAPSTAATNAAAILHWPAAATTAASALGACACAATLSGPVCDEVLEETEGRVVARALGSQPSPEDAEGAGLRTNGKTGRGARAQSRETELLWRRVPAAGSGGAACLARAKRTRAGGRPALRRCGGNKLRVGRAGGRPPGRPPFCPASRYWERAVVAGFPPRAPLPLRTLFRSGLCTLEPRCPRDLPSPPFQIQRRAWEAQVPRSSCTGCLPGRVLGGGFPGVALCPALCSVRTPEGRLQRSGEAAARRGDVGASS